MKKLLGTALAAAFLLVSAPADAQYQAAPLGNGNISFKVGYLNFTDSVVENSDVDSGVYFGFDAYFQVAPSFYLGFELGYGYTDGNAYVYSPALGRSVTVDTSVTYVPLEFNFKYMARPAPNLAIGLGAGLSTNYVEEEATLGGIYATVDDWLFGGQVFADINYVAGNVFFGGFFKYQITEDFKDTNYDYSNWRIGGQIGFTF